MFGLASPRRLRQLGIVGMNKRNVVLIARNNPRHLYPLVDDKVLCKARLQEQGLVEINDTGTTMLAKLTVRGMDVAAGRAIVAYPP